MVHENTLQSYMQIQPELTGLRLQVYSVIKACGPLTDNEITEVLQINPSTARPRRIELERMGLIETVESTTQINGRKAALWRTKQW